MTNGGASKEMGATREVSMMLVRHLLFLPLAQDGLGFGASPLLLVELNTSKESVSNRPKRYPVKKEKEKRIEQNKTFHFRSTREGKKK